MCVTYEITTDKKCNNVKFFVQPPFFDKQICPNHPHSHIYSELHIVYEKSLTYNIEGEIYTVNYGEIIVIPKDVSHHIVRNNDSLKISFLVDYDFKDVFIINVNKSLVSDFALEIEKSKQSQNFNTIRVYLSFFFNYIATKHDHISLTTASDYKFLIHDFFTTRFNEEDVKLSTLSKTLSLSERQTERLIVEYTGKNFREFLAYSRIKKAKELIEFSDMSMNEIASFVGYKSYSGFWKAMKKYSKK